MTVVIAVGTAVPAWADAIQFSKPAVELAAPQKAQENLPEPKSKRMDFSPGASVERPVAQPPPVLMRVPPSRLRDLNEDEDADRHPLLREFKDYSDPLGRSERSETRNRYGPARSGRNLRQPGELRNKDSDAPEALSPITDMNWDPRERDRERDRDRDRPRDDAFSMDRSARPEKKDARERELYGKREAESDQKSPFEAPEVPDVFTFRPNKPLTAAQLERRAEFDQLLNPAGANARPAGSLEPVSGGAGLDAPRPGSPVVMPIPAGPKPEFAPSDPGIALRMQQERLRPAVPEDVAQKFSPSAQPAPVGPVDSRFQGSLMRQPTYHEIPSRKGL